VSSSTMRISGPCIPSWPTLMHPPGGKIADYTSHRNEPEAAHGYRLVVPVWLPLDSIRPFQFGPCRSYLVWVPDESPVPPKKGRRGGLHPYGVIPRRHHSRHERRRNSKNGLQASSIFHPAASLALSERSGANTLGNVEPAFGAREDEFVAVQQAIEEQLRTTEDGGG